MADTLLVKGERNERNDNKYDWPLPCVFCNTILQGENVSFESCIEYGLAEFVDGVLIQEFHIPDCPTVNHPQNSRFSPGYLGDGKWQSSGS